MGIRTVPQSNSPVLQAGKFRHRVTIVQPSLLQDAAGGWTGTQNNVVCKVWATIEALSGTEKFAAHEFTTEVTHSIYIRYPRSLVHGGILAKMEVHYTNRVFLIEAVLNADERNKFLQLVCVELDDTRLPAV